MSEELISLLGVIAFGVGILLVYYSTRVVSTNEMSVRIDEFVAHEQAVHGIDIVEEIETRDLMGSLFQRLIVPVFRRLGNFIGKYTPVGAIQELNRQLGIAGYPMRMGAREFYGLRVLVFLLGLSLTFFVLRGGVDQNSLGISILILLMVYILPINWLRGKVRKRQDAIRKGLPDALDMLSVCATAGLGFDQALQRLSEEWKTPVSEEFGRMLAEMDLGISRQESLRSMEARLKISELSSFISVILQSEKLGMSIAETLQAQAEQMRIDRRFRAQEIAQKMPAKMLFPLAFLILPAIMAVLLGPSIPVFVDLFFNVLAP